MTTYNIDQFYLDTDEDNCDVIAHSSYGTTDKAQADSENAHYSAEYDRLIAAGYPEGL